MLNKLSSVFITFILVWSVAYADESALSIEITKGEAGIPIAIVPFEMEGIAAGTMQPADIIQSDLELSGLFNIIPSYLYLTGTDNLQSVQYKNWRLLKAEAVVVGRVVNIGNSQYEMRFRLVDVYSEKQLVGKRFLFASDELRQVAHQISDIIYQALIGQPGAFNTRIAYVTLQRDANNTSIYDLQIADSDGWNAKTILQSPEPILSPVWSPDGNRLSYVSFENNRSVIFVQNVWTGQRQIVADYKGINGAPAWSPDGKKLALTLSKDGNSEVYIKDLATNALRRMTNNTAIDTEPSWSPDGKFLLFTSDRSGSPQIYRLTVKDGATKRITFDGTYNAAASYSPDAEKMIFITKQDTGFKVAVYSFDNGATTILTESSQDESPSFAPNGDMIVYATKVNGRSVLSTLSLSSYDRVKKVLSLDQGVVREPTWSPYRGRP